MKKEKFKKYSINKGPIILSFIFFGIFFVLFIAITITTNTINKDSIDAGLLDFLLILKEFSLVISTILGGSLLSILCIEVKSKNNQYISNIANDIISDENFYEYINEDNRKLLKSRMLGADDDFHADVMNSVYEKICSLNYYYDECNLNVVCNIDKETCKKTIVKTMKIRSFREKYTLANFRLVASSMKKDNTSGLTVKSISIDGKKLKEGVNYLNKVEDVKSDEKVLLRNGYSKRCYCELIDILELSQTKSTNVVIEYETVVSNDDYFTNRLSGPCKKYTLAFAVNDSKKNSYDICGSAFGFMESGVNTPNIEPNHFKIEINGWCFKDDGVSLMYKKTTKNKKSN